MDCVNPQLHENRCNHKFEQSKKFWRVASQDGCQATVCEDCFLGTITPDVIMIAMLDSDGIPLDQRAWSQGDVIANIGREMLSRKVW